MSFVHIWQGVVVDLVHHITGGVPGLLDSANRKGINDQFLCWGYCQVIPVLGSTCEWFFEFKFCLVGWNRFIASSITCHSIWSIISGCHLNLSVRYLWYSGKCAYSHIYDDSWWTMTWLHIQRDRFVAGSNGWGLRLGVRDARFGRAILSHFILSWSSRGRSSNSVSLSWWPLTWRRTIGMGILQMVW